MTVDRNQATIMSSPRPAASLVVKQGPQIGIRFPITGNRLFLGREEGCDIVIQDAEASRRHCELSWELDAFIMQDLGSSNGTFVNGAQLTTPTRLKAGDSIGIGQTGLVLEMDSSDIAAQTDYEAPKSKQAAGQMKLPVNEEKPDRSRKWLTIGCGCLLLLCACSTFTLLGLDLVDILDLGISGFSELNLPF